MASVPNKCITVMIARIRGQREKYAPSQDQLSILMQRVATALAGIRSFRSQACGHIVLIRMVRKLNLDDWPVITDTNITTAAKADADNLPLTTDEMARMEAASVVRRVRTRTGLSQDRFAKRYKVQRRTHSQSGARPNQG